jgi:hypothetical protein
MDIQSFIDEYSQSPSCDRPVKTTPFRGPSLCRPSMPLVFPVDPRVVEVRIVGILCGFTRVPRETGRVPR